jgi:hypothetical protein
MKLRIPGIRPAATAVVAVALLSLTACGPGRGSVTGKVTYRNKPVVYGSVVFVGPDRKPISVKIEPDGTFTAAQLAAGENRVAIHSPDPRTTVPINKHGKPQGQPEVDPKLWFPIPDQYIDPDKSNLIYTVRRRTTNPIEIDLK